MRGLGTLTNVATVVGGTTIGLAFGARIPDRIRTTTLQVIGMTTVVLGVRDTMKSHNVVFPLLAVVLGGILGELLRIEDRLAVVGEALRRRYERRRPSVLDAETGAAGAAGAADGADAADGGVETGEGAGVFGAPPGTGRSAFVTGFVTATLLFCIGPMTILGSMEDGTGRSPQLLIIKSCLDGFMSVIFATVYGVGVAFSAVSILVVQGLLTLGGSGLDRVLDDRMATELFAAGGLMVLGIGLRLLDIKPVRVASLLPGLVLAPLFVWLFARPGGLLFQ